MFTVSPVIAPEIYQIAPGFQALSIAVQAAPMQAPEVGVQLLQQAIQTVLAGQPDWADAHIQAWEEVFKKFGAKPKKTLSSIEALRKRVLRDGEMPSINPLVDLYNAVSLAYALPVGGENFGVYQGMPQLKVATGTEPFDTMKDGAVCEEFPSPGEVVWADDKGVTCRRWNWRQGIRSRLEADAQQMWFVLERLPQMPAEKLLEAGKMLTDGLEQIMPGVQYHVELIEG